MHPLRSVSLLTACVLLFIVPAGAQEAAPKSPIRFRVKLPDATAPEGAGGRLLVFMQRGAFRPVTIGTGFIPGSTHVAAMEVGHIAPGGSVEMNPDVLAFPTPFSRAKAETCHVMALLDRDHSYTYNGQGPGDLRSAVETLENADPANAGTIELTLSATVPESSQPADTDTLKTVEFQSPALTEFWGRPIHMRAVVALPPTAAAPTQSKFPTVYHVQGFSANAATAWREAFSNQKQMAAGQAPPMIHVFLDPSCPGGHHAFADSVNNGPWGRALTTEFIPHLEKRFGLGAKPQGRFLTGHSSGGWSSLWLQITYPEFFGGTWSTAPDPVDLRNYTGINVTPGSKDNAYREPDGSPKQLVRGKGKWLASFEDFARQEEVIGDYGGQFASFEWVWSPRGRDGRPMRLFNRANGVLNPAVLEAWQRYDIRRVLDTNWETLAPKLEGKLNLFCGSEDQFRLNESFELLRAFLKAKGSTAVCELIEGRSHSDLGRPHPSYPQGLNARIYSEMAAKFAAAEKGSSAGSEELPAPK